MFAVWARAVPAEEPVRLRYDAPAECPDAERFEKDVLARTAEAREAEPGELARLASVSIGRNEQGLYAGHLELTSREGQAVAREVSAKSCDDLVEALVVMTALALDAQRPVAKPEEHDGRAPSTPVARPRALDGNGPDTVPTNAPAAERAAPRPHWTIGAAYLLKAGIAPVPAQGAAVSVERSVLATATARGWVGALRSAIARRSDASARVDWLGGGVEGCPIALRIGAVTLAPCAAIEGGAIHSQGLPGGVIVQGLSRWDAWLAGAVGPRAGYVAGPLAIDLDLALVAPLTRVHYWVSQPRTRWYDVPAVGWMLSAGAGAVFR